jgi:hypothetical protein
MWMSDGRAVDTRNRTRMTRIGRMNADLKKSELFLSAMIRQIRGIRVRFLH